MAVAATTIVARPGGPGIYPSLSMSDYRNLPAVSRSQLWAAINQSPAHAWTKRPETAAMSDGSAIHCATLEPKEWERRYAPAPNRTTRAGKDRAAQLEADGLNLITPASFETACRVRDAVHNHPIARQVFSQGQAEESAVALDPETGLLVKVRPDYVRGDGAMADLKTTEVAAPNRFATSCARYGYHLQAAMYPWVWEMAGGGLVEMFVIVAVEKSPPYAVAVYELDQAAISAGLKVMHRALALWKSCRDTDHWPSYPESIQTIYLPDWAYREE